MEAKDLAQYIDHTTLKAFTTEEDVRKLCEEAKTHHFYSVCLPPSYLEKARKFLKDSEVKLCTVIAFPLGYEVTTAKVDELRRVEEIGVDEVDVVINIGAIKNQDYDYVNIELNNLATFCSIKGLTLKIIIETCYLTKEEIVKVSNLCVENGVDFVKTSTGFGTGGATVEDVKLIKSVVGDKAKVKASGGIRNREDALAMIAAGADRLGASSGIKIITG